MIDKTIDTRCLRCPLPILKAKRALADIGPGGTLEVLSTDPGATADFEAFCEVTGHTLLTKDETNGIFRFVIRKRAA